MKKRDYGGKIENREEEDFGIFVIKNGGEESQPHPPPFADRPLYTKSYVCTLFLSGSWRDKQIKYSWTETIWWLYQLVVHFMRICTNKELSQFYQLFFKTLNKNFFNVDLNAYYLQVETIFQFCWKWSVWSTVLFETHLVSFIML